MEQSAHDDQRATAFRQQLAARQWRTHLWVSLIAVQHPVLCEHQHTSWTIDTWHYPSLGNAGITPGKQIRCPLGRLAPLANHMVQT